MAVVVYWEERGVIFPTVCLLGSAPVWLNQGVCLRQLFDPSDRYCLHISKSVHQQLLGFVRDESMPSLVAVVDHMVSFLSGVGGQLMGVYAPDRECLYLRQDPSFSEFRKLFIVGGMLVFFGLFSWGWMLDREMSQSIDALELHLANQALDLSAVKEPALSAVEISDLVEVLHEWPVALTHLSITPVAVHVVGQVSSSVLWDLRKAIVSWNQRSGLQYQTEFSVLPGGLLEWHFHVYL